MSICIAAISKDGDKLYISADSRTCTIIDGEYYYIDDNAQKIQNIDGQIMYISGHLGMANEVAKTIENKKPRKINDIQNICRKIYAKWIKTNPNLKQINHALQLVAPLRSNRKWSILFIENDDNFEGQQHFAYDGSHFVFGCGKGSKIVHPIIDRGLNKTNDILKLFSEAYSKASCEYCGGTLTMFELSLTSKEVVMYASVIKDSRSLKRLPNHGVGDGAIVSPNGLSDSGRGYIKKPDDGFYYQYFAQNTADLRELLLNDDGISIKSINGNIILGDPNASHIKIDTNGDIDIIGKNVKINGERIDLN